MTGSQVTVAWQIDQAKITRYLLDLTSKRGASKAKYLLRFGFLASDPDTLAQALVDHAITNLPGVASTARMGNRVVVFEGTVLAPDGRAMPLRTVWEPRDQFEMHFITAVPLTR